MKLIISTNKTMDNVLKEQKFDPIKGIGNRSLNRLSNNSIIHYFPDVDCFLYDAAFKSFSAFYDTSTRNEWSNNRVCFFVENSYEDALKKAFRFFIYDCPSTPGFRRVFHYLSLGSTGHHF